MSYINRGSMPLACSARTPMLIHISNSGETHERKAEPFFQRCRLE